MYFAAFGWEWGLSHKIVCLNLQGFCRENVVEMGTARGQDSWVLIHTPFWERDLWSQVCTKPHIHYLAGTHFSLAGLGSDATTSGSKLNAVQPKLRAGRENGGVGLNPDEASA